eukprot:139833_1
MMTAQSVYVAIVFYLEWLLVMDMYFITFRALEDHICWLICLFINFIYPKTLLLHESFNRWPEALGINKFIIACESISDMYDRCYCYLIPIHTDYDKIIFMNLNCDLKKSHILSQMTLKYKSKNVLIFKWTFITKMCYIVCPIISLLYPFIWLVSGFTYASSRKIDGIIPSFDSMDIVWIFFGVFHFVGLILIFYLCYQLNTKCMLQKLQLIITIFINRSCIKQMKLDILHAKISYSELCKLRVLVDYFPNDVATIIISYVRSFY